MAHPDYYSIYKINVIIIVVFRFDCQVWELTANGVVMVSAIGNDGPLYGLENSSVLHLMNLT